ncbi:hypothetical protein LJK88_30455 [Paenibacillus sp. P26]|nr:hypothetical protein LJK88_30455 [Paenibacillus sp. P26]
MEVSHSIVSIDLSASKAAENTDIMKDLFEIPKGMFASSTNINQVLVRVLDASNEQGERTASRCKRCQAGEMVAERAQAESSKCRRTPGVSGNPLPDDLYAQVAGPAKGKKLKSEKYAKPIRLCYNSLDGERD